jgi:amidase
MTRTIADAALMQNTTSGPHPLDHDSLRNRVRLPVKAESIRGMKIAYSLDFGYVEVDPEVRRNTLAALAVFRGLGAEVNEVDLGWTPQVDLDCFHWYNAMHFGRQTIWHREKNARLMTDYALKRRMPWNAIRGSMMSTRRGTHPHHVSVTGANSCCP